MTERRESSAGSAGSGYWQSPVSAELIFEGSEHIAWPRPAGRGLFFLLSQPAEDNLQALMFLDPGGGLTRVSPAGINVRSRVHEYGALPYAFTGDAVFYCNLEDQRLLRQPFDQRSLRTGDCHALTPAGKPGALRYGDFIVDAARRRLICVREDHRGEDAEPVNALVAIDVDGGGEGEVLFAGSDFVASPCLAPDGATLVFQTWDHPNMPWDDTRLRIAAFDGRGHLRALREVRKDAPASLVQPLFNDRGELFFIADWSDWWNLYRVKAQELEAGCRPEPVFPLAAEFCPPQWQLGQRNYAFLDDRRLLVSINRDCFWDLALLDLAAGGLSPLVRGLGALEHVFCQAGRAIYSAATPSRQAALYALEPATAAAAGESGEPGGGPRLLFEGRGGLRLPAAAISLPEHFDYPGTGGLSAYGLFYPPCNPDQRIPPRRLPPLLVCVHGGPTSSARTAFNPVVQFWTSRGFAVLDVNHRGSTGYGRRFRHSLYGRWGEADVADVCSAVRHLAEAGRVDADRIFIRGGSAGGYVVLSVLAQSDLFRAGASYYGISDLELLAADTHKFESRYMDLLIGPLPEARELYRTRSPLHRIGDIQAPVLLLQGLEDKVVPPNQAEAIHVRLRARNPATRLLCFPDEGHGFRKPANQVKALLAELAFYGAFLEA